MAKITRKVKFGLYECTHCHRMLAKKSFYKASGRTWGIRYVCKECLYKINLKYYPKRKAYRDKWRLNWKKKAYEKLGNKCVKCGFTDQRALQIDHINGGGIKDNLRHEREKYYRKIYESNENEYQLLCANCNWIKRWEKKESKPWGKSL